MVSLVLLVFAKFLDTAKVNKQFKQLELKPTNIISWFKLFLAVWLQGVYDGVVHGMFTFLNYMSVWLFCIYVHALFWSIGDYFVHLFYSCI